MSTLNVDEKIGLELDGFTEYITDVTVKNKIDDLAVEIIKSQQTNYPIIEFRVEGHADIARRINDPAERKWFEDNISWERAMNGFDLLIESIKRKSSDNLLAQKIAAGSRAFGLGTRNLKIPHAHNESEYKKNRRIVFIIRQVKVIPQLPPDEPPTSVIEDRYSVRIIRGAVVTVGMPVVSNIPIPTLPTSVTVSVTLEVKDYIDRRFAQFNVIATGGGFGGGPTPIGGSLNFSSGPEVRFKTFRLLGSRSLPVNLENFNGSVTVFVGSGGSLGGHVSVGGELSFSFDALEASGMNTNPTIITIPGGNAGIATPGIDIGYVAPIGFMTMLGAPSNF